MRVLRPFVWAAVLVAVFLYITSVAHWDVARVLKPVERVGNLWTEPASAAGHLFHRTSRTISISTGRRVTPP